MARGQIAQSVVFCVLFGVACAAVGERAAPITDFAESLSYVMFRYTKYVMALAPFAVLGSLATTLGNSGPDTLLRMGKLVLTLYAALLVCVVILVSSSGLAGRIPLGIFLRAVREPFLIAFATSASEATLPRAMENLRAIGVPANIAAFVLPMGYSFNLVGTALYLSIATVFVAQAAGIELPIRRQLLIMITLTITSRGVAGVPRVALVILTTSLASFGLPTSGVAILLGLDAVFDMARTSVNVLANCLTAVLVARWDGVELRN